MLKTHSINLYIISRHCVMYCYYCLFRGILYPRVHALHLDRPMDAGPWSLQAVARDGLSALYCFRLQHSLNQLRPLPVCHQSCTYSFQPHTHIYTDHACDKIVFFFYITVLSTVIFTMILKLNTIHTLSNFGKVTVSIFRVLNIAGLDKFLLVFYS